MIKSHQQVKGGKVGLGTEDLGPSGLCSVSPEASRGQQLAWPWLGQCKSKERGLNQPLRKETTTAREGGTRESMTFTEGLNLTQELEN